MISESMWQLLTARRFSEVTGPGRRPATKNVVGTVAAIHRLIEEGHSDKLIAERLCVTVAQVNYRRQKTRGLR